MKTPLPNQRDEQKLQKLKEIIYEKVPRLKEHEWCKIHGHPWCMHCSNIWENQNRNCSFRPIRLNHVLEALHSEVVGEVAISTAGSFMVYTDGVWQHRGFFWEGDTLDQAIEKNPDLLPFLLSILTND